MVIYATQDLIKDPPFTKLDLLSCRNLLIYLEPELQSRLIPVFHFALKPGGILFLSSSESIGSSPDLFTPINRKWRIYKASGIRPGVQAIMDTSRSLSESDGVIPVSDIHTGRSDTTIVEQTRRVLLQTYAPPSVVTDDMGNILYVHGDTGKFLRPAQGQATLSVIEMAREGLQLELRTAIFTARTQKIVVTCKDLQVRTNGGFEVVTLEVRPISSADPLHGNLIISFLVTDDHAIQERSIQKRKSGKSQVRSVRVDELEQELLYTKESLQATIEEMQAANEELKSTNEELQSTNEELQSTNEELETSKEEIQSVNEEMLTVNSELQTKIVQLAGIQNDMKNLLSSTGIGTIFLNTDLAIRWFTPEAAGIYKLVNSDVGRPLGDIKSMIVQDNLVEEGQIVLDSLIPKEKEIQTIDNHWFLARISPYRTLDNVIDGVVLSFTDINNLKAAEEEVSQSQEAFQVANKKLKLLSGLTRHDILNDITVIRGFLSLIDSETDLEEVRKRVLSGTVICSKMEATIGFTKEYESFGTISSGWQLVYPIIESVIPEVSPGDITIENLIPKNIEMYGEPILRKVFSTLIENGIRHGENITSIRFYGQESEGNYIITCEDNGIGIPAKEKELIFDHKYGKHSGIGLFLAREILSITGLSIRESGLEGKGAKFEIIIPAGKFRKAEG